MKNLKDEYTSLMSILLESGLNAIENDQLEGKMGAIEIAYRLLETVGLIASYMAMGMTREEAMNLMIRNSAKKAGLTEEEARKLFQEVTKEKETKNEKPPKRGGGNDTVH